MIGGIILAAGESRRMGRPKLLLPYGSGTIIDSVVESACASTLDRVVVVTGHRSEAIAERVAETRAEIVHNPDYAQGMLSSVRRGLLAFPSPLRAVMVLLGDQPGIGTEVIDAVIQRYREGARSIVIAAHNGRRGHPMLFDARYRTEVLTEYDEAGLRGLLETYPEEIDLADFAIPEVLTDIDTPGDYLRARNQAPGA